MIEIQKKMCPLWVSEHFLHIYPIEECKSLKKNVKSSYDSSEADFDIIRFFFEIASNA